jgi:hypothetical protein
MEEQPMRRMSEPRPPFSYPVKVGHVSHNPIEVHVEADERERKALAELWDIESLEELVADLKIGDGRRTASRCSARSAVGRSSPAW